MRLICPNCSAQYEIDGSMIPDEGRDVQCSNCGNTWFELPSTEAESAMSDEAASYTIPEDDESDAPSEAFAESTTDTYEQEDTLPSEDDGEDWDWPKTKLMSPAADTVHNIEEPAETVPRRPADLAAMDVLKEEADREIEQRRSDNPSTLETQSEMGLQDPRDRQTPSRALRARMARLRSEDEPDEDSPGDADYTPPRRDLLPDIEEINSSLKPGDQEAHLGRTPETVASQRKGFRFGFVATVAVAAILVAAYAWAPAIASAIPSSEGPLLAYVDWANSARDLIDRLIATRG